MTSLTVIVTAFNDAEGLKYTLEGLVEQSTEDFDVLIVDNGSTDETAELIAQYCSEYIGFNSMKIEHCLTPAARNAAVKQAKGELVYFIDGGDYISPESVEKILETAEKTNADIISPRYYFSGDSEPYYEIWMEMLACVPDIDRFDRALLNTMNYDGRVYKKKFFDLYSLSFPEIPILYNMSFLAKCLYGCDAKISGCTGAIYDRKSGVFSKGFPENAEPSKEGLRICAAVFEPILEEIKDIIEEKTGAVDGDEYTVQEFLFVYFVCLVDNFYRYFWYIDDEALEMLKNKFEALSLLMTKQRRDKLNKTYSDLRFPGMYISHDDAKQMPLFSLLADFTQQEGLPEFISSLYIQKFPFFDIYIRESLFNSGSFPERWKNAGNLHVLPDKDFFAAARSDCKGIPINVKDNSPIDPRILSELSVTKAPQSMFQYIFASKRKKYATKTYLKKKGLSMQ